MPSSLVTSADLAPGGEVRTRAAPFPLKWATAMRECGRCGARWEEAVPFKSPRKAAAYFHGPSCTYCDFDPWRKVKEGSS